METDQEGENEDVIDVDVEELSQAPDHDAIPPNFAAWHGSVGANVGHTPWTNEGLNDAAIAMLPKVSELLDILFDEDITRLRGLWMGSHGNGHRTQAFFGTNSLEHIMEFVHWLARRNHPLGIRAWELMVAIIHDIEEMELTSMGRTNILQNVLMAVLEANARGTLVISQTDSEKLARAICRLLQVAQCRYAAVAAEALASGERLDRAAFWREMRAGASGRGVANALRPMYQEDNQLTKVKIFLLASPISRDLDGKETPVLAACAFEATFPEMRMQMAIPRVASSDLHKCFKALKLIHEGVDGTPIGNIENFMLALGLENGYIAATFGLHKPVPPPPTPQPPTPQPPTVSPRPSPAPTPAPTYTAYNTNMGMRVFIIVAQPDSEYFATLLLFLVGPYKLVNLVPEHGNPDVVREAIFHLYNSGVRMGDTRLADLLLDLPCGRGNWVPGPTFEAVPELRV